MQHHREFRRFAEHYSRYNLIQERVAKALSRRIYKDYDTILDLGCGSGGFFRAYERQFIKYYAVDLVPDMLDLHPEDSRVVKIVGDFDDPSLFTRLSKLDFDILVSSSALQWSRDLSLALNRIASLNRPVAMAIFTSGTFASLHKRAGISSPIRSKEETIEAIKENFDADIEILEYRLYFKDTASMLRYIKRSGVSGGERILGYSQTKMLLESYKMSYLEFEVVVAVGK